MNICLKDTSTAHKLILLLFLAMFGYMLFLAYDHSELRSEINDLKESASKIAYAQLSSDITQRSSTSEPAEMQMRLRDVIHGVGFDPEISTTDVKILHDGIYFLMAAPRVEILKAGSHEPACANFFFTINNKPLANSSVARCFSVGDPSVKDVVITQSIVPLHTGDEVSVMIANTDMQDGTGVDASKPEMQPVVPSIIFSMFRLGDV